MPPKRNRAKSVPVPVPVPEPEPEIDVSFEPEPEPEPEIDVSFEPEPGRHKGFLDQSAEVDMRSQEVAQAEQRLENVEEILSQAKQKRSASPKWLRELDEDVVLARKKFIEAMKNDPGSKERLDRAKKAAHRDRIAEGRVSSTKRENETADLLDLVSDLGMRDPDMVATLFEPAVKKARDVKESLEEIEGNLNIIEHQIHPESNRVLVSGGFQEYLARLFGFADNPHFWLIQLLHGHRKLRQAEKSLADLKPFLDGHSRTKHGELLDRFERIKTEHIRILRAIRPEENQRFWERLDDLWLNAEIDRLELSDKGRVALLYFFARQNAMVGSTAAMAIQDLRLWSAEKVIETLDAVGQGGQLTEEDARKVGDYKMRMPWWKDEVAALKNKKHRSKRKSKKKKSKKKKTKKRKSKKKKTRRR